MHVSIFHLHIMSACRFKQLHLRFIQHPHLHCSLASNSISSPFSSVYLHSSTWYSLSLMYHIFELLSSFISLNFEFLIFVVGSSFILDPLVNRGLLQVNGHLWTWTTMSSNLLSSSPEATASRVTRNRWCLAHRHRTSQGQTGSMPLCKVGCTSFRNTRLGRTLVDIYPRSHLMCRCAYRCLNNRALTMS
jgi:hypothetical protein